MRLKFWLWISAVALFMVAVPVVALNGAQDPWDRPEERRFRDDDRGYVGDGSARDWRDFLAARGKPFKERDRATPGELREFERFLRDRRGVIGDDVRRREDERLNPDREREWREFQRLRNRPYRDYSSVSRQERNEFEDFLRNRGVRPGDWDGNPGVGGEPRYGACFYTNSNFGGERLCFGRGERVPSVGGHFNDRFSSIRLFGGAQVTIFKDNNFRGSRRTYSSNAPHLGNLNDEITSIEVR